MKYYHATPVSNADAILKEGLTPKIGAYASEMGEATKAIWMFPSVEDAEEMIPIWLEPIYGDDFIILEITLPDDWEVEYTGSDYEVYTTKKIDPEYIRIYEN